MWSFLWSPYTWMEQRMNHTWWLTIGPFIHLTLPCNWQSALVGKVTFKSSPSPWPVCVQSIKGTGREKGKASGMSFSQENLLSPTNKTGLKKIRRNPSTKHLAWDQILTLDQHEQFQDCLWVANAFYCSGTYLVSNWGCVEKSLQVESGIKNCQLALLLSTLVRSQGSLFIPTQIV